MVRLTDRPAITIAVDLGRKTTKQTKKNQKKNPCILNQYRMYEKIHQNIKGLKQSFSICKIVKMFLPTSSNQCFEYSKERSY